MRPKLTQYLIDKGYINEAECKSALQRQVLFGGRFGTNLLELCVITEKHLLEGMSMTFGLPAADTRSFDFSQELIDDFPAEIALKYGVIPLLESKGKIYLAMLDPHNLQMIDEISFTIGKGIQPHVATEMEINRLLKEFYGADTDRKFIILRDEYEKRVKLYDEKHGIETQKKEAAPPPPFSGAEPGQSEKKLNEASVVEKTPSLNYTDYFDCLQGLADVKNREDIADVLMAFAKSRMDCVVLFEVKGDDVHGWRADGMWDAPENIGSVKFSIHENSVIRHVAQTGLIFRGSMADTPVHMKILESLGGMMPEEILAIPILVRKDIINVLIGNNSRSRSEFKDVQVLKQLVDKAVKAFDMLILRAEILFK
jgi:hypothetical protein